jgi:YD repeat-containing protein
LCDKKGIREMIRKKILLILVSLVVAAIALPCFGGSIIYRYDDLYRLIRATYPNGTVIEYTYDKACNRLGVIKGKQVKHQVEYDEDGTTDIAIWRPSSAKWYIKDQATVQWGLSDDVPLAWNIWILKTSGLIP